MLNKSNAAISKTDDMFDRSVGVRVSLQIVLNMELKRIWMKNYVIEMKPFSSK